MPNEMIWGLCFIYCSVFCVIGLVAFTESFTDQKNKLILGDPETVARSPFPLPVQGTCDSGQSWNITNVNDLYNLPAELECLWTAAYTPKGIPTGFLYGKLLAFTNTAALDPFTKAFYQGDFVYETQCGGVHHKVGHVKMAGLSVSYGIWSINKFPLPIVDEEYYDGKESIVMDFSIDLKSLCHGEGIDALTTTSYGSYTMRPFQTGSWPFRLFIDLLRVAGCDRDGGVLLLGRTFMLDPERSLQRPSFTVLYFVLKTYDPIVTPDGWTCGDAIVLDKTFKYHRHGAGDFLSRLDPIRYAKAYANLDLHNGLFNYTQQQQQQQQQ